MCVCVLGGQGGSLGHGEESVQAQVIGPRVQQVEVLAGKRARR